MADTLTFDPATEYEILETIEDFQEEIQRPEELRFFTLDDQLTDYKSKVLYGKRKITKHDEKLLKKEVDRYRLIYDELITFVGEEQGYVVRDQRTSINVPWVKPIYSEFKYVAYPYTENWMPLMDESQYRTPNYYERMLKGIPRPYSTVEKVGHLIRHKTELVNEDATNQIQALSNYVRTKGVLHEDGTFNLQNVPVSNTEDDIYTKGYYIGVRPKDIPKPLADHPFLSSNTPNKLITDEPLLDVFPTIKAILTHGVPTTTDPYGEGATFLKIYDVKFSQIDWSIWKERFPPVDTILSSPPILSIDFPTVKSELGLSESVQKEYLNSWAPGFQPRFWLMMQEDGGRLIAKMYLKNIGDAGNVPPEPPGEKLQETTTESTPEECLKTDSFETFLESGIYRSPDWDKVSKAVDKDKPIPIGKCIPADVIVRERSSIISKGRVPFLETTPETMIKEYRTLLRQFIVLKEPEKEVKYEKFKSSPDSELQKDILTILKDENRSPEDQADSIQVLLNLITPKDNQYYDKEGGFLICEHTLSLLRGDLEKDRLDFYDKWCTVDAGYRVCKFCGEQVNTDVFIAQDEFTSDGKPVINYDVLETSKVVSTDHNISSVSLSLSEISKLFNLEKSIAEQVFYLILQLLQVLPSEGVLLPILQYIRNAELVLKSNKKIEKEKREKAEGVFGIVAAVILLQTHIPFLIPKRTFGIKTFRLSGFPRDTDDSSEPGTLDSLIFIIQSYFKKFSSALKGGISKTIRGLINNPKEIKTLATTFLKQSLTVFKSQFEIAKERYIVPAETKSISNFSIPLIKPTKSEYSPDEKLGSEELMMRCLIPKTKSVFTSKTLPVVSQPPLELWKNISMSKYAQFIEKLDFDIKTYSVDQKDIRKRLGIGFTKLSKNDKIEKFLKQDTIDVVSVFTLTNRILDIISQEGFDIETIAEYRQFTTYLETKDKSASLLRDIAKGILYELLQKISKDKNKEAYIKAIDFAVQRDVVLNMLFFTKDAAQEISSAASTKEREFFKKQMRTLTDDQREVQKALIDIGMAPYIVKNEDRELFAREYNYPDPEEEYETIIKAKDEQKPEDGYNDTRDYVEDGMRPQNIFGQELEVDYGDYGDRAVRPYDDYSNTVGDADFDEGYGT
jgi:hypothetical protein